MLPRFLHKTFILAVSRFQPDVIVYLGDLFDEGSKAQEPLFQEYVQRFKDIFRTEEHVKVQIQWNHLLGWSQLIFPWLTQIYVTITCHLATMT